MGFYAVKEGRQRGIYKSWEECENQVKGYKGAKFKKFKTEKEALAFLGEIELDEDSEVLNLKSVENLKSSEGVAYVDGSFDKDSYTYSYGVVFFTSKGKEEFSGRENDKDLVEMRNVSGELAGAMKAMEIAVTKGLKELYLHYDYSGIENWAMGNWKRNKEGTKKYKEFYDSIKDKIEITFIKVPAHKGIKYNEEADKLAKEAL